MEPDTKASVEQQAQPVEQGNVQDGSETSALSNAIADAKKYRHQRQELEKTVTALQDKMTQRDEAEMQKNNEWKDLATKYKSERDEYKSLAEEGKALKESTRKNLLDQLSDDDKEFAIDLSTEKLTKFVARQAKIKVETNEAYSRPMPDTKVNPFTEMKKEQRQNNWGKVLENYTKR
jgi:chromosome segregation ATPase